MDPYINRVDSGQFPRIGRYNPAFMAIGHNPDGVAPDALLQNGLHPPPADTRVDSPGIAASTAPATDKRRRNIYYCAICNGLPFTNQRVYGEHVQRVHGELAFSCYVCGRRVARYDNLITHMRACHPLLPLEEDAAVFEQNPHLGPNVPAPQFNWPDVAEEPTFPELDFGDAVNMDPFPALLQPTPNFPAPQLGRPDIAEEAAFPEFDFRNAGDMNPSPAFYFS